MYKISIRSMLSKMMMMMMMDDDDELLMPLSLSLYHISNALSVEQLPSRVPS